MSTILAAKFHISAASPTELTKEMIKTNVYHGILFKYDNIQFADGKWYAWYIDDSMSSIRRKDRAEAQAKKPKTKVKKRVNGVSKKGD